MDYLRRLHPAHADPSAAARLDAPAAMAVAATSPPATFEAPASASPDVVRAQAPNPTPQAVSRSSPPVWSPRAPALNEFAVPPDAPHRESPAGPSTSQPLQLSRTVLPSSVQPTRVMPPPIDATAAAQPTMAPPLSRVDARAPAATRQLGPAAAAVSLQPLRQEAVRERDHIAADEPAPIIHVTIDRIDVRLPSPTATPPAPGRRRAAPSVGALGDYLRGRATEGSS